MLSVYLLTIRQLTGKWRLVIMSVLALMPIGMAVMAIWSSPSPSVEEFEIIVFSNMSSRDGTDESSSERVEGLRKFAERNGVIRAASGIAAIAHLRQKRRKVDAKVERRVTCDR